MDKKYFIPVNGNLEGPFSPDELLEHGLTPDSRIFCKGWTAMRTARDIPEFSAILERVPKSTQPTDPQSSVAENELLKQILEHLEDLKRENRELKEEMGKMRATSADEMPVADVKEEIVVPPPPFTNVGVPFGQDDSRAHETPAYVPASSTDADKSKTTIGERILISLVVILILAALFGILYSLRGSSSSVELTDTASYYGEEAVVEVTETEAVAPDGYYDYGVEQK